METDLNRDSLSFLSQMAGATHFMMLDPHTPQLEGFFGKPVDSLKVGSDDHSPRYQCIK